ncbi:MAG TPA: urease accessory UreF family protein [Verrucomicrobiae bacterium]
MRLHDDWLIWQLADSAFPTGGFAHSGGLEAAWQHGEIRSRADLMAFAETSLQQLGYASLPFMRAVWEEPERLVELDARFDVFTTNHVTNRASRLQGRAFWMAAERSFPSVALDGLRERMEAEGFCGHLPPVFGAVTAALGLQKQDAIQLFFFCYLRGIVASAVRLGIVGPMEAQSMQHRLSAKAQVVSGECAEIPVEEAAQTAPLLDLWQGAQDRLYSRLFQS